MRKTFFFAYVKTKEQISCSITAQLISTFVFAIQIVQLIFLKLKLKLLAGFCDCTGRFMLDLVRNPGDRFSRAVAQLMKIKMV